MYLFAKEAGALTPLGGSNPPVSAYIGKVAEWLKAAVY
jgi:hypothetical protein